MKKYLKIVMLVSVGVFFALSTFVNADPVAGKWKLVLEVVKGPGKGAKIESIVNITQEENGRIDGKTVDSDEKQVGRLSGLAKRTIIEMTFSQKREVYRCSLHLSHDGNFFGGIFKAVSGGEGIVYGIKQE